MLGLEGQGGAKHGGVLDVVRAHVRIGVEAVRVGQELCCACWESVGGLLD